eukprot:jgi/Chrzof1/7092/Cz02g10160.t1
MAMQCDDLAAKLFPPCPLSGHHILLTRLKHGERLFLVAVPKMGTAKEHARWAVASCVAVAVKQVDKAYTMTVESECRLSPQNIVITALEVLRDKVVKLQQDIPTISWEHTGTEVLINIDGEDHTLANLLQSILFDTCIKERNTMLQFIGYYQPHPLEQRVILRLNTTSMDAAEVKQFMVEQLGSVVSRLSGLVHEAKAVLLDVDL